MIAPASYELEKLPPSSLDAEQAVLGSCLLDPDALVEVAAPPVGLKPEDFHRDGHRLAYAAMLSLRDHDMPRDIVTVTDELERRGQLPAAGGVAYLHSLATVVPTAIHAAYYAAIVKRTAAKRRLISAGGHIASMGYDDALEVEQALAESLSAILGLAQQSFATGGSVADVIRRLHEPRPEPIDCGLPSLRKLRHGGWRPGELCVLTGPASSLKTTLATFFALQALLHECAGVVHVSNEVDDEEMVERYLCLLTGIDSRTYRARAMTSAQLDQWEAGERQLEIMPLELHYDLGSVAEIALRLSVAKARRPDVTRWLLVVDYLQLLDTDPRHHVESTDRNLKELQRLAIREHVPVLLLSSLSRADANSADAASWVGRDSYNTKGYANWFAGLKADEDFNEHHAITGKLRTTLVQSKNRRGIQFAEIPLEVEAGTGNVYELDTWHEEPARHAKPGSWAKEE